METLQAVWQDVNGDDDRQQQYRSTKNLSSNRRQMAKTSDSRLDVRRPETTQFTTTVR